METTVSRRTRRINVACTHCRQQKRKCSGERPRCAECSKHGAAIQCRYENIPAAHQRRFSEDIYGRNKAAQIPNSSKNKKNKRDAESSAIALESVEASTRSSTSPPVLVDDDFSLFEPSSFSSRYGSGSTPSFTTPTLDIESQVSLLNEFFGSYYLTQPYFHRNFFMHRFYNGQILKGVLYMIFSFAARSCPGVEKNISFVFERAARKWVRRAVVELEESEDENSEEEKKYGCIDLTWLSLAQASLGIFIYECWEGRVERPRTEFIDRTITILRRLHVDRENENFSPRSHSPIDVIVRDECRRTWWIVVKMDRYRGGYNNILDAPAFSIDLSQCQVGLPLNEGAFQALPFESPSPSSSPSSICSLEEMNSIPDSFWSFSIRLGELGSKTSDWNRRQRNASSIGNGIVPSDIADLLRDEYAILAGALDAWWNELSFAARTFMTLRDTEILGSTFLNPDDLERASWSYLHNEYLYVKIALHQSYAETFPLPKSNSTSSIVSYQSLFLAFEISHYTRGAKGLSKALSALYYSARAYAGVIESTMERIKKGKETEDAKMEAKWILDSVIDAMASDLNALSLSSAEWKKMMKVKRQMTSVKLVVDTLLATIQLPGPITLFCPKSPVNQNRNANLRMITYEDIPTELPTADKESPTEDNEESPYTIINPFLAPIEIDLSNDAFASVQMTSLDWNTLENYTTPFESEFNNLGNMPLQPNEIQDLNALLYNIDN